MRVFRNFIATAEHRQLPDLRRFIDEHRNLFHKVNLRPGRRNAWCVMETLNLHDKTRDALLVSIRNIDLTVSMTETIKYDPPEILGSPACFLRSHRRPLGSVPSELCESIYDYSTGCDRCGTGSKQVHDLTLAEFSPRRTERITETMDGHWILHATVRDKVKAKVPNASFRPVHGLKKAIKDWFQLVHDVELSQLDPKTEGLTTEDQCPVCRRDGFFGLVERDFTPHLHLPLPVRWNVAASWECFGNSRRRNEGRYTQGLAQPKLCVNLDIASLLLEYNGKAITLVPIRPVD